MKPYHRYTIETTLTPNILPHPPRFQVKVKKWGLAKLLIKELVHYRGKLDIVLSRPCVYGVFSGPIGGFAPREKLCVGCLRCTTEHPDFVSIFYHPDRKKLGDEYFTPDYVDTVTQEAETGHIPIRGQGYRGKFGGTGWDGIWTDMSEIVRPTRDGIHGREFISTEVDLGGRLPFLTFPVVEKRTISSPLPFLFDVWPDHAIAIKTLSEAARHLETFATIPIEQIDKLGLKGPQLIPLITKTIHELPFQPLLVETNPEMLHAVQKQFPEAEVILRTNENLLSHYEKGVRVFHITANYHGTGILDLIKSAHETFLKARCRGEVTLIGSGGIIAAEHVPKAILCGLDAVGLDTALLVALQARFKGSCSERDDSHFELPRNMTVEWGTQRLKNLAAAWRDQLLEILGAMGLREVRRLRGELGRALIQKDLEKEAFSGIEGYE